MSTNFSELINGLNIDESGKAIIQKIVSELLCVIAADVTQHELNFQIQRAAV
jgi:hypothetical protein